MSELRQRQLCVSFSWVLDRNTVVVLTARTDSGSWLSLLFHPSRLTSLPPVSVLNPPHLRFCTGPFRTACHRCKAPRPAGMGSDDSRQQSGQGRGHNYSHSGHGQRQPMSKRTRHAYNSDRNQGGGRGESGTDNTSFGSGNRNPPPRGEWRGEEPPSEPPGGLLLA